MRLYVMEKFCDFFTLRAFDLNTILTYVLMDNFCPCLNVGALSEELFLYTLYLY